MKELKDIGRMLIVVVFLTICWLIAVVLWCQLPGIAANC